jgi:hypothetical protein
MTVSEWKFFLARHQLSSLHFCVKLKRIGSYADSRWRDEVRLCDMFDTTRKCCSTEDQRASHGRLRKRTGVRYREMYDPGRWLDAMCWASTSVKRAHTSCMRSLFVCYWADTRTDQNRRIREGETTPMIHRGTTLWVESQTVLSTSFGIGTTTYVL